MSRPSAPLHVRLLAFAITCVVSGLGLLALYTQYAPERWTRYGRADALQGDPAVIFGLTVFCFGLLPLMIWFKSQRAALLFGGLVGTLGVVSLFGGIVFLL